MAVHEPISSSEKRYVPIILILVIEFYFLSLLLLLLLLLLFSLFKACTPNIRIVFVIKHVKDDSV